eukprot:12959227-Heterocapsa_arctica.AAC.1
MTAGACASAAGGNGVRVPLLQGLYAENLIPRLQFLEEAQGNKMSVVNHNRNAACRSARVG